MMRKFATESGKSKGQFYTPAEVSRILANVVGISRCTDTSATVCDPACGSGSLLIRAIDAAPIPIMGYGQEKESTTAGLAKMNAVLHRKAEITIKSGNTFSNPQYLDKSDNSILERFDYIVANPPFSMKNWRDGIAGKEQERVIRFFKDPEILGYQYIGNLSDYQNKNINEDRLRQYLRLKGYADKLIDAAVMQLQQEAGNLSRGV